MKPSTSIDSADLAFGACGQSLQKLMPPWSEVPSEFKNFGGNEFVEFVEQWFSKGADSTRLIPKSGIDRGKALTHCQAIMRSWEPKHERKIASVAYLLSQWFDLKE